MGNTIGPCSKQKKKGTQYKSSSNLINTLPNQVTGNLLLLTMALHMLITFTFLDPQTLNLQTELPGAAMRISLTSPI